ncbi:MULTISPECIES: OadG family protein [Persicobacter]|uniref:Oxaloacetate decarboxylase n=1 Tax=Persicobacter diffluens TaxID=981 RepID=A0AAN5AJL6_9BACT|nr:OadG family protein [Persicobacter sp. CCB-QB2]GJM61780.1 oxaloacetate decarboxylase [Persicobacter diffluens]
MNEALQEAAMLLAIGMITVFLILFLIVGLGNVLIQIVNRFFPEEKTNALPITTSKSPPESPQKISTAQLAAITAAVNVITHGKGHITSIDKVS